jgi:hypothetical protein
VPKYTDAAKKEIRWLRANLKTALIHAFTDKIIKGNPQQTQKYVREVIVAMSETGIFGTISSAVRVNQWFKEAESLVEIHRQVAPEGLGRETHAVRILLDELQEIAVSNQTIGG